MPNKSESTEYNNLQETNQERFSNSHIKSRTEKPPIYPERFSVPDEKVSWDIEYPAYDPEYFVADVVLQNDRSINSSGWADSENLPDQEKRDYDSYEGKIELDSKNRPLNPRGRTGLTGRGLLGKWGPNFAADPIITRTINDKNELLVIVRKDTKEYALPGGMVDKDEKMSLTATRELKEEAGIDVDMSLAKEVYKGYVDDPRNTDNAWMETSAYHIHLTNEQANQTLRAGDDARDALWIDINEENLNNLYASHSELVYKAIKAEKID